MFFRKEISSLLSLAMVMTTAQPLYASSHEVNVNPFQKVISESEDTNSTFNAFFQLSLNEKNEATKVQEKANPERFNAQNFLLGLPQNLGVTTATGNCDLNKKEYIVRQGNLYSKADVGSWDRGHQVDSITKNKEFSKEANEAYCQMQTTFADLTPSDLTEAIIPTDKESDYSKAKEHLRNTDTMVIVIPGIFGEFIEQVAFGEIFGQGLTKLGNPNYTSSYTREFQQYLSSNKLNNLAAKPSKGLDNRFLVKNLRNYNGVNDKGLFNDITVDQWIKVSSVDDKDGQPLFKVAVLGLEPMSLESLGKQEKLAMIYSNRLNKFMDIYKDHKGNYPDRIIFIGYSRGTPVAQEMLTVLTKGATSSDDPNTEIKKGIQKAAAPWVKNIKASTALGGVVFGSALADASVVYREKAPANVLFLQQFKKLMFSLQIISEDDVKKAQAAHELAQTKDNYFSNETESVESQKPAGIAANKLNWKTITLQVEKEVEEQMFPIIEKIGHNLATLMAFKRSIEKMDASEFPPEQQKAFAALIELLKFEESVKKNIDQINTIQGLNHLVQNFQEVEHIIASVNQVVNSSTQLLPDFMGMKELLYSSNQLIPDLKGMSSFNKQMAVNFGFIEAADVAKKSLLSKNLVEKIQALTEVNNLVKYFVYYFSSVWAGASELGTIPRLSWLAENGQYLPKNITYYSMIGIMGSETSDFYTKGLGFGFNVSSDESFLNNSWDNLQKVGTNDGLDLTFKGSKLNDSQVDWYKTILWPNVVNALTGTERAPKKVKILGVVKTHHWGLALPFSFLNKTSFDPNTGMYLEDKSKVDNVNPFPRGELLKAMVLTIDNDLAK